MTALDRAERLFNELAKISADAPGVTRASFGPIENAAHDIIRREAKALGLEQRTDAIGNHYVTLAGRNREAPVLMIGSIWTLCLMAAILTEPRACLLGWSCWNGWQMGHSRPVM